MNLSADAMLVFSRLRPPFARSAYLLYPYTSEGRVNNGITYETLLGEPAVAAGAGTVKKVYTALPDWQTSSEELKRTAVKHVVIDHGNLITTLVGGLTTVSVNEGQTVYRGDRLGDLYTNQLFFSVAVNRKSLNPSTVNQHWIAQNGNTVTGQAGKVRFAPDRLARDLSHGVRVIVNAGIRYFVNTLASPTLLVNVAFNGDGTKTGNGATGYGSADHWNVYSPVDFQATASSVCYYYAYGGGGHYDFSSPVTLTLNDYTAGQTPVFLERIAPLFSAAGSGASWDSMLKAWVGGYLGPVPYENTFRLRSMPAGDYELYLYANQGASTFYVSVGAGLPSAKSNSPTGTTAFVENLNYVKYSLAVPSASYITLKAVGYFSGLQLKRV